MLVRQFVRKSCTSLIQAVEKGTRDCRCHEPLDASYCNVALIGADTKLGELTAFLLKQNPLITTLHLQGGESVEGLKKDLSYIDTRCRVVAHTGSDNYRNAMKTADIIALLGAGESSNNTSVCDRIMAEGHRVCKLAEKCTKHARRAIIVVCVAPVSVTMPLVTDIFRRTHWYHPARIVGFPGPITVVINTEVGHHQCFDPNIVDVPIIGGPDLESVVPVFSKAVPCPVDRDSAMELTARLRGIRASELPRRAQPKNPFVTAICPEAIALNRFISAIAYGIHGDEKSVTYAHVRSNIVKTCRFMVSQVRFGLNGVAHNYGIPQLSRLERDLLERSFAAVSYREYMAMEYLEFYLSNRRDCLPGFKQREIDKAEEKKRCAMQC